MIQDIYLSKYSWSVRVYYIEEEYPDALFDDLEELECPQEDLLRVEYNKESKAMNTGFIFTNAQEQSSVIVIGPSTDASEFQNTFDHEKGHLAMHISQYYDIDPYGEGFQYLTGEIGKELFKVAKLFLCDTCRGKAVKK